MLRSLFLSLAVVGFCGLSANAADLDLSNAKCPVGKTKAVNANQVVEYNGAKVFLCCGKCKAAFEKNPAKFASRANAQLVATKQATQKSCPITGGKLNSATAITVSGAEVCFCCNNCKGKANGKSGDEQVNFLFGKTAFAKGFELAPKP